MSISDLYDTGFQQRNEDHFAAIVRVAMDDGVITESEKAFLDRLAFNLGITDEEYKVILKDYRSHDVNPPVSYNNRIERLYDLTRMVHVDHIEDEQEVTLLRKLAIGLGFSTINANYIVDKALALVRENSDLEDFTYGIKHLNH